MPLYASVTFQTTPLIEEPSQEELDLPPPRRQFLEDSEDQSRRSYRYTQLRAGGLHGPPPGSTASQSRAPQSDPLETSESRPAVLSTLPVEGPRQRPVFAHVPLEAARPSPQRQPPCRWACWVLAPCCAAGYCRVCRQLKPTLSLCPRLLCGLRRHSMALSLSLSVPEVGGRAVPWRCDCGQTLPSQEPFPWVLPRERGTSLITVSAGLTVWVPVGTSLPAEQV